MIFILFSPRAGFIHPSAPLIQWPSLNTFDRKLVISTCESSKDLMNINLFSSWRTFLTAWSTDGDLWFSREILSQCYVNQQQFRNSLNQIHEPSFWGAIPAANAVRSSFIKGAAAYSWTEINALPGLSCAHSHHRICPAPHFSQTLKLHDRSNNLPSLIRFSPYFKSTI